MLEQVQRSFGRAKTRRAEWEPLWRDCYAHALPQRTVGLGGDTTTLVKQVERLFDGTAADAAEQLAASLLAELMPPWSQWFGLRPGLDARRLDDGRIAEQLEAAAELMRGHFDRSNFAVEIHQCLLDLAAIGTATLQFSEAPPGSLSAFQFHAVPTGEMFLEGDQNGRIRHQFRQSGLTLQGLQRTFPDAQLPPSVEQTGTAQPERTFEVIEAVLRDTNAATYWAYLPGITDATGRAVQLTEGRFDRSPFITFRWLKSAGELYGRSPVMTALPDIKTANKVVELVLKNASIAATGIWLADDDGVLNPANVKLIPGSIIPKAVGSAGLTPLQAPGRFDVSELVLADLRTRIRHTLLVDRLGPVADSRMTATEVLERSTETARLLGAVFGRLQAELLTPLIERGLAILERRGEVPAMRLDGRMVEVDYRSPLARAQARDDVRNTLLWLENIQRLGPEATGVADQRAAALWLARTLGVPSELVRNDAPLEPAALVAMLEGDPR